MIPGYGLYKITDLIEYKEFKLLKFVGNVTETRRRKNGDRVVVGLSNPLLLHLQRFRFS